ncbi:MAG TPA: helix-turn-helix transcriptional regulator [Chitinophaga sp.]|nr:helix-turn-helix transcriptional regulator [Chitinophaga sp.]
MSIGSVILRLRNKNKWSQGELADKIGLRRASLSDIETGKSTPSESTLQKLSDVLNVSVDYMKLASFNIESVPEAERDDLIMLLAEKLANLKKLH